jgi:hypothetical protein
VARGFEGVADGGDAAVHHVGRRDDIAARLDLEQRLLDEDRNRFVVGDVLVVAVEHAVVAVARVGIERHIAEHADLRHGLLDRTHRAADEVLSVQCLAPVGRLERWVGIGEQRHDRDAERGCFLRRARDEVHRQPVHAGHGGDGRSGVRALGDEDRPDEIGRAERVLGDQPPRPVVAPQAAHAQGRKSRVHGPVSCQFNRPDASSRG